MAYFVIVAIFLSLILNLRYVKQVKAALLSILSLILMPDPLKRTLLEQATGIVKQLPAQYAAQTPEKRPFEVSPGLFHTLGGLADAASTYYFLKKGERVEGNPLLSWLPTPATTAMGVVGGMALGKWISHLLNNVKPGLGDAFSANLGYQGASLAAHNFKEDPNRPSGFDASYWALVRNQAGYGR